MAKSDYGLVPLGTSTLFLLTKICHFGTTHLGFVIDGLAGFDMPTPLIYPLSFSSMQLKQQNYSLSHRPSHPPLQSQPLI